MNHIQTPRNYLDRYIACGLLACGGLALSGSGMLFGQALPNKPPVPLQKAMPFSVYVLDVDPNPYAYTIRVNGWTLSSSPGDANTHFSSTRLGLYLVQGKNIVSIHIGLPPKGVPPGHKFDVKVRDAAGTAAAYHWDPAKPHAPIPVQAETHFEVPHLPLEPVMHFAIT